MEFHKRKLLRLQNYDYSTNGIYFLTICSYKKMELFSNISKDNIIELTTVGKVISDNIAILNDVYTGIDVHNYVIMPNHVHMLIELNKQNKSIPQIMSIFKSSVSKQVEFSVWQKSYYDHIIRNFKEYQAIYYYIDENPNRWSKDCYFNAN